MANSPSGSPNPGEQEPFVQISSSLLQYVRSRKLTGSQYDLWLYLYELDPYGDRWIDIPSPAELAQVLGYDARTIQRNAIRLQDCDLFDFAIKTWKARNVTARGQSLDFPLGKEIQKPTNRSKSRQIDPSADKSIHRSNCGQNDPNVQTLESSDSGGSSDSAEIGNVPNKKQTCSENNKTIGTSTPTAHPVTGIDSEGIGTNASAPVEEEVERLSALIRESGVRPNKTILETVATLVLHQGSAAATKAVENAISALQEQQEQTKVENPGGFLNAALKRGFTANLAKSAAKEKRQKKKPDQMQIERLIDTYLLENHRDWAQGKLQGLCDMSWSKWVSDLCKFRSDWGFYVHEGKVLEVQL